MIKIIDRQITLQELEQEAAKIFGDIVKAVVDIDRCVMAINGELHADEEVTLLRTGSKQQSLWGINLYPELYGTDDWLEFDSMINLRPSQGNNSRGVDDSQIRNQIRKIVNDLVIKE